MTDTREFLSGLVLLVTATTLFYAALTDLREFKIRNEMVIALACLYAVYAWVSGTWVNAQWNVGLAVAMFVVCLVFYGKGWLGGGDVKILTVAFLWVGLKYALPFTLLLMIFAVGHVVLAQHLKWANVRQAEGHRRLPFAPSVAAALIGIFIVKSSGLL